MRNDIVSDSKRDKGIACLTFNPQRSHSIFRAFTLKRLMPFSNHAVFKSSSFDAGYENVFV